MARESFVKGAVVLSIGLFITKLLGFYRLVLPRVMGSEGVGLFNMAYPVYSVVLVLSTAGIPVAISKLVAERYARGDQAGAARVFRLSCMLLFGLGLLFSTGLFLSAGWIATHVSRDPRSYYALVAVSPAILFVSLMSAYRGLFQGLEEMGPAASSFVVEQIIRVGTLFVLAFWLLPRGLEFAAAGAAFGAVTGGLAGLIYLHWQYRRRGLHHAGSPVSASAPASNVIKAILLLAIPISLAGLVFPVMQNIDLAVVPARLQSMGIELRDATALYGKLSGEAMPIVYVPTVFTTALAFSLVPAISSAAASGDVALVRSRSATALRVTMAFAVPATVGIYLLATDICRLMYAHPEVGPTLAAVSGGVLFLAVQQTTSGILQGLGRTAIPVRNLALGAVIKLVITWLLVVDPQFGIRGAAYGTVLGFLVAATLNLLATRDATGIRLSFLDLVARPAIATVGMAVGIRAVLFFGAAWGLSPNLVTLAAIFAAILVYGLVLLLIGGVTARDLEAVPGPGRRLAKLLRRIGLVRE